MPEVPQNMQQGLARLEQQAQRPVQYSNQNHQNQGPPLPQRDSQYFQAQSTPNGQHQNDPYHGNGNGNGHGQGQGHAPYNNGQQAYEQGQPFEPIDQPNFSRFPVLHNPPPNIPPTAEQKEQSLEFARLPVLGSNDPLNQLDWAQDALAFVEEAIQNEERINNISASAVRLSRVQQLLKDDAMKVIQFLADQEHPRALVLKGIWLEFGKFDHAIDKRQAWQCYKAAVKNGAALHPSDPAKKWGGRAQYRIGMQFENSKDIANALKHYQLGVDVGDSAACYRLGMMILLGQHGQIQDFQRGLSLIFAAAQNADENAPQGAYVLGMLQARELPQVDVPDRFLPLDISTARTNVERAAFLGFARAQVKMGGAYELCELGCPFDPALSLHYNNLAARQGEVEAEMAISKWFLAGHEGVFEKDEEMAFSYAQRAAQDGLPTAQFAMGYFHEIGIFVQINLQVAREWYKKAAGNGNADAAGRIDSLSRSKTLSRKDHERIAVSKIKKSRLQSPTSPENAPPAQTTPQVITMPDPGRLNLVSPTFSGADQYLRQGRQSAVPYPANDPSDSQRPGMVSHSSNFSNPEIRPGSAFGINPNLRPSSAATIAGTRPDQQMRPSLQDPPRPHSRYEASGPGHGRGGRVASGPQPQGYPGPGRGAASPHDFSGAPQPPPKVDIGFLAPLEVSGPDRKKVHNSSSPVGGKPAPNARTSTPSNARPQRTPNSATSPAPGNAPLSPIPPRTESLPQKPPTPSGRPPHRASQQPPSSSAKPAAATRPPGKGPKTFEEMGVPSGKGKDDCVSLPLNQNWIWKGELGR